MKAIFEDVLVLSLAEQYPGPFATMLMADLGADVVLVERPQGGDPSRVFPAFFRSLARNKRSVCIDLKSDSGREQFLALASKADVVLEGFRPGTMDRLGIGYGALKTVNDRLIYASISGFGQDGPYRDRTAHDLSYQAVAGLLFDHAHAQNTSLPQISYADLASAMFAAFAVASALYARERSGCGTAIDVSMTDGLVSWMTAYLSPAMAGEATLEVLGEPAYGIFSLSGGRWITLSIAHENHFWRSLCELLDMKDIAVLSQRERIRDACALRARIAAALAKKPIEHWGPLLDAQAIPWSPVNDLLHVLDDPHFRSRGLFQSVDRKDGTSERHVVQPVRFSAWDSRLRRPAPALGEHTDEVFAAYGLALRPDLDRSTAP